MKLYHKIIALMFLAICGLGLAAANTYVWNPREQIWDIIGNVSSIVDTYNTSAQILAVTGGVNTYNTSAQILAVTGGVNTYNTSADILAVTGGGSGDLSNLDFRNITDSTFPTPCSDGYAVKGLNSTHATCVRAITSIDSKYQMQVNMDAMGKNINNASNISIQQSDRLCLNGMDCTAYISYNGSHIVFVAP